MKFKIKMRGSDFRMLNDELKRYKYIKDEEEDKRVHRQFCNYLISFIILICLLFVCMCAYIWVMNKMFEYQTEIKQRVRILKDETYFEPRKKEEVSFNERKTDNREVGIHNQTSSKVKYSNRFYGETENFFYGNGFIFVDRKNVADDEPWCSEEKLPPFTVQLFSHKRPSSVTYHHKSGKRIQYRVPKKYDVYACYNKFCKSTELLPSDCVYSSGSGLTMKKQPCDIPKNPSLPVIDEIQVRIRENHGKTKRTCAYLFRFYGQEWESKDEKRTTETVPIQEAEPESMKQTCSDIAWINYNFPTVYTANGYNCSYLHAKNCCGECPECCQNCKAEPVIEAVLTIVSILIVMMAMFFFGAKFLIFIIED